MRWKPGGSACSRKRRMRLRTCRELIGRQGHDVFLFMLVPVVFPAKGDLIFFHRDQPIVGEGHAMGVAAHTPAPARARRTAAWHTRPTRPHAPDPDTERRLSDRATALTRRRIAD